ncbi:MAG TPA: PAS domain S-box protein [Ignavibacteria bacterium]|nr:PAS domain S-box protein [Ignavibacteria bacterium]
MDKPHSTHGGYSLPELVNKLDKLTLELDFYKSSKMNKRKLDILLESSSFPFLVVDENCAILFGNTIFINLLELEKEKLSTYNFLDFLIPDKRLEKIRSSIKNLFNRKSGYYRDRMEIKSSTSSLSAFDITARFFEYDDNLKQAVHIILQDISEEVKFKEAYKNVIENSLQAIFIIQDFKIVFANQRAAEISGYTAEELCSLDINGVKQLVHPNDRERLFELMRLSLTGKRVSPKQEFMAIRKDGMIYWIEILASFINYNGKPALQVVQLDVSEKKHVETQAINAANKFEVLVEQSMVGIYIITGGLISYVNPHLAKMFEYDNEEIVNKLSYKDVVHPDDLEMVQENIRKRLGDEITSLRYEFRGVTKSGKIINVEVLGSRAILDGKPSIIGLMQDITDRKRTESALKISEEKLRNIIEHSNEMFYIHDTNHVHRYVSPQSVEFLGYTPEELMIKWTDLATDNPINQIGFMKTERAIQTGEKQEEYLLELMRKDKSRIYVQVSESPIKDEKGIVIGITGALRNVTEKYKAEQALKENEERFRSLYENAILGIYRTTPSGEIIMANPALCKLLGYDSADEFKRLEASGLYEDPLTRDYFVEEMNKKGELHGFETTAKRKDGSTFNIRESARAVKDSDGNILYYEGIIEDITNHKQAEEKLIEAKNAAVQSDKLKSEFLAQMSHEIRTPINVIFSFTNLIKDEVRGVLSDELFNSFSIVDNASRRIIRTIDLILNMSQLQTGSYQSNFVEIDLYQDILLNLYPELSRLASEKHLSLKINNDTDNAKILGDEYSVRQIFDNLIHNAIKYTHKGNIFVNLSRMENKIKAEIIDTGIGISKDYLPKLFSPFTQEEHGYTRKYEGNGLGLALVKKYCELNKTEISVESEKNVGSKFTLLFPLSKT